MSDEQSNDVSGSIDRLSGPHGEFRIEFRPGDSKEKKAEGRKVIKDMLAQGYHVSIIGSDGEPQKVSKFDPERDVYIVKTADGKTEEKSMSESKATGVPPVAGG